MALHFLDIGNNLAAQKEITVSAAGQAIDNLRELMHL
jgi:hypothetical protein